MARTGEFARSYGEQGHRPGVWVESNQTQMPSPPTDWIGVKVYGQEGELIEIRFVPPQHDDRLLLDSAWRYFDDRTSATAADASHPRLRLERP